MSAEEYNEKFNYMVSRIPNTKYIFEVYKKCGYSEFLMIDKYDTLSNLYQAVARQFDIVEAESLFIKNEETGKTKRIPNTNMCVRDYVHMCYQSLTLRYFLRPIYQPPTNVVYRIIFDCCNDGQSHDNDGHSHGGP